MCKMTTGTVFNGFDDFVHRMKIIVRAMDQSSEGIAVADGNETILYVNRTFAEMHGAACEDFIGKHPSHFNSMEESKECTFAKKQLEETGHFEGEVRHKKLDGTEFPVLERNLLVRDEEGNGIGIVVTARELSEIEKVKEELKESEGKYLNTIQKQRKCRGLICCHADLKSIQAKRSGETLSGCHVGLPGPRGFRCLPYLKGIPTLSLV
jgi:PAS domain S-box-containing protein